MARVVGLLLAASGASALQLPTTSRRDVLNALAGVSLLPASASAKALSSLSLSDMLDDVPLDASKDALQKSEARRAAEAAEAATKEARAAVAIQRMEETKAGLERAQEKAIASSVPMCPDGIFGTGTGVLSAQACVRKRDGIIDAKKGSGFMVIF